MNTVTLSLLLCLIFWQVNANSQRAGADCTSSLTNNLFDKDYDNIAIQLLSTCEWNSPPAANHLAMIFGYRNTAIETLNKVRKAKVGNLVDLIPTLSETKNLTKLSEATIAFDFPYEDDIRKKTHWLSLKATTELTNEDIELVKLSHKDILPIESGHFRFHFDRSGKNYDFTRIMPGKNFTAPHRIDPRATAEKIMSRVGSYRRFGKKVVEVEYVHTHPYDSMILYDEQEKLVLKGLNLLSFTPPMGGDVALAALLQRELPNILFKMTAIVGAQKEYLSKVSYNPPR